MSHSYQIVLFALDFISFKELEKMHKVIEHRLQLKPNELSANELIVEKRMNEYIDRKKG